MADLSKNEKAEEIGQPVILDAEVSSDKSQNEKIHHLLNDENDPDLGKSPEERAAIVRPQRTTNTPALTLCDRTRN